VKYHAKKGNPHILICGQFDIKSFQQLVSLVRAKSSAVSSDPSKAGTDMLLDESTPPIVLLSANYPNPQLELLLIHPLNAKKVFFFVGSVKSNRDLERVKASRAMAVFILEDSDALLFGELDNQDAAQTQDFNTKLKVVSCINYLLKEIIVAGKAAKKATGKDARKQYRYQDTRRESGSSELVSRPVVIAQSTSIDACSSLLNYGADRMVELNSLKYSVLAYGAMFPGFISLMHHLALPPENQFAAKHAVKSSKQRLAAACKRMASMLACKGGQMLSGGDVSGAAGGDADRLLWEDHVRRSRSFSIQEIAVSVVMSDEIKRLSFSQLCRFLYRWSAGTVVCVGVYGWRDEEQALINPERRVIIDDCRSVFFMCNNLEVTLAMLQTKNVGLVSQTLFASSVALSSDSSELSPDELSSAVESGGVGSRPSSFSPGKPADNWTSWREFNSATEVLQFEESCVAAAEVAIRSPSFRESSAHLDRNKPRDASTSDGLGPTSPVAIKAENTMPAASSLAEVYVEMSSSARDLVETGERAPEQGEDAAPALTQKPNPSERFVFKRDKSSIRKDNIGLYDAAVMAEQSALTSSALLLMMMAPSTDDHEDPSLLVGGSDSTEGVPVATMRRGLTDSVNTLDTQDSCSDEEVESVPSPVANEGLRAGPTSFLSPVSSEEDPLPKRLHPSLVSHSSVLSMPSGRNLLLIPEADTKFNKSPALQSPRSGGRRRNFRAPRRYKDHGKSRCF
jgi:hypothetical protein